MDLSLIQDIVILFGLSVVVTLLFQKIKLPTLLGYLMTGIISGPYGLSLIKGTEEVDHMAEIGVIFLLFLIGIEFSLKQLISIKRAVFVGGTIQALSTIFITAIGYYFLCGDWNKSIFIGFLFSLSSTAIVLKILSDKGEMHSPHARLILAILIFQDLLVVPMVLLTPLLAGAEDVAPLVLKTPLFAGTDDTLLRLMIELAVKLLFVLLLVYTGARYIVPKLLFEVAKTRSQDLFILTTILICFSVALLCHSIGLSLALGAFLAGLIISESEYSHQATGNILPFREIFTSFFFVSIGMLLDLSFLTEHLLWILGLTLLVVLVKTFTASLASIALNYPPRTSFKTGLALFQVGEFAFILSKSGIKYGLLDETTNQYFLSISILSMALTPVLMNYSEKISKYTYKLFIPHQIKRRLHSQNTKKILSHQVVEKLKNHLIIIGYGVNGQNLSKACQFAGIPYIIIELNAETVKEELKKGEPIVYGDAMQANILEHARIAAARSVVIAISDLKAAENVISSIRRINKSIYIIVRTRSVKDVAVFMKLGASEVIPEEFETSVEIFTRVLNKFLIPKDQIEVFIQEIRTEIYDMMRPVHLDHSKERVNLPYFDIVCLKVEQDRSSIVNKTLTESALRSKYGVQVLAIQRDKRIIHHVDGGTVVKLHDSLFISGDPDAISRFSNDICI
ncbi:MAG: potassium transporter KefB [Cytophagaceae bacterium]|jgi:CPA2 family monovalent cation:H+ antiporter-2|nr:potassium transporter KefB [Cytophagaceae bacterium]